MGRHRVVITGIGAVTPLGLTAEETWASLKAGRSGIGPITSFDVSDQEVRIAAEVRGFDPEAYVSRKEARRLDRFVQLAVGAALSAVEDARLSFSDHEADGVGVCVGSGIGGITTWENEHGVLLSRGPSRVSPFFVPMMISNMASGYVSMHLGARGPNTTIVTACATGSHCIGEAYHIVARGDAWCMVAGGSESAITPLTVAGFANMRALSTRNDDPTTASRPFDRDRDGFVLAEGAGVVVLETLESAERRGAPVYGEIIGHGMTGDAFHVTQPAPEGQGARRAMQMGLENAGVRPEEVDYINAHGTSTPLNDRVETEAIKAVFREAAYRIPISSTKSMHGHLLGAAGGVELIACLLAMRDSILPPTINYCTPDPDCDLDYVPNQARRADVQVALSNSFGFGGQNATLVVRKV